MYNCTYRIVVWLRMQVRAVFRDPEDSTCLSLLFANQTEDDILLRCTRSEFIREREETLSITGKSLRRWPRRTRTDSSCGTLLTGGGKRGSFCLNRFQKYLPLCLIGRVKTGSTVLASSTPRWLRKPSSLLLMTIWWKFYTSIKFFLLLSWNIVPKVSCCCRHVLAGADVRPTPHDQLCLQSQSGQVGLQPAPEVLLLAMGQL